MQRIIMVGFIVHFVGMFCDAGMILRMHVKSKIFQIVAVIAVSVYTLCFMVWLVFMHIIRYSHRG